VQAIRALLGASDGDVLTGVQATEAAVKAASAKGLLARARYVHFATHGFLGVDTGQPPALVLSLVGNDGQRDADGSLNDGFLRLDEVTRLKLNADLVVLSACETGKGRLYAGEGVTGLARAFLYAGSRGVVCSLWAVDDRETAALMMRLYAGLKDGQGAADALRAAKLAILREGKPPSYWAPFILIGE
jgi:CHAT domain-containing protein